MAQQDMLAAAHAAGAPGHAFAAQAGQARVIAPDLIGFGMSDKLKKSSAYSLDWHAQVLAEWLQYLAQEQALDLASVQLVLQTPAHPLLPALIARSPYLATRSPQIIAPAKKAYCSLPYPDQGHKAALSLLEADSGIFKAQIGVLSRQTCLSS